MELVIEIKLVLALIKNGYNIMVLNNLSPEIHGEKPEKTFPFI